MMHRIVGMGGIIKILIQIASFSPEVFIEAPAQSSKCPILIETGLATILS
jgi:hypothetical protein